jgi:type I restriction enzyme S subunit
MLEVETPESWEWVPLKDVGKWQGGKTPKKSNPDYWEDGSIPWVSPKDMKSSRISDPEDYMTEFAQEDTNAKIVPEDSVLFVTRSGILEHSLPVAINEVEVTINQDMKAFIPKDGVDARYVLFFARAFEHEILRDCTKDGTTVASINSSDLYEYEIPLPNLSKQKEVIENIDSSISKINAGIEDLREAVQKLEAYKTASESSAMDGGLTESFRDSSEVQTGEKYLRQILDDRFELWKDRYRIKKSHYKKTYTDELLEERYDEPAGPDKDDLPEIPENWTWATIEQLAIIEGGLTKNKSERQDNPIEVPYLRVANVYANELDLEDVREIRVEDRELNKCSLEEGDLLIVEGNGSKDQIGRVAIWDGSISPCVHQNHLIKIRPVDKRINRYMLRWLLSQRGRRFIVDVASSTSGLHTLSLSKVRQIPIPLPPFKEIQQLTNKLDRRITISEQVLDDVNSEIERGERLSLSVMRNAFKADYGHEGKQASQSKKKTGRTV